MLETIGLLLKTIIIFGLLYVVVPYGLIKIHDREQEIGWADKAVICFIHANIVTILLVHVLVLINIYETFSLVLGYIVIFWLYRYLVKKKIEREMDQKKESGVARLLDLIDEKKGIRHLLLHTAKKLWNRLVFAFRNAFSAIKKNPIPFFMLSGIFVAGAYIRFSHSLKHLYYSASDPYVHLAWTKYLNQNRIYVDGVYPYGYNALISALNRIFFTDAFVIIRFMGAIGACMIIFSVYYVLKKYFKNNFVPILVGVAAYALSNELPINFWRQMAALPQEYALALFLPGIHFLLTYFQKDDKRFLLYAAETLALALLLHLYVAAFMAAAYAFIGLLQLHRLIKPKVFIRTVLTMFVACVIGIAPLLIGLAFGIGLHEPSFSFVVESATTGPERIEWARLFAYREANPVFFVLLIGSLLVFLLSVIKLLIKKQPHEKRNAWMGIAVIMLTLFFYTQYQGEAMGIPVLMEQSRTAVFLGLFAVAVFAWLVSIPDILPLKSKVLTIVKTVIGVLILLIIINISTFQLPVGERYEYDEAAYAYMRIRRDYPVLNWTIVSPVEQYQQSIGYGWHYQLWEYVQKVDDGSVHELEFPTEYVFWFVETIPLNQSDPVSKEDAQKPFPIIGERLDDYYLDPTNRRIIQAKAYYRMEELLKQYEHMELFVDTPHMRVYKLWQHERHVEDVLLR